MDPLERWIVRALYETPNDGEQTTRLRLVRVKLIVATWLPSSSEVAYTVTRMQASRKNLRCSHACFPWKGWM